MVNRHTTRSDDPYVQNVIDDYRQAFPWADESVLRALALSLVLFRAQVAVLARLEDFLVQYELTPARYRIVRTLFLADGGLLPLNQISRKLQVSMANITKQADWLEQREWLQRVAHPTDRRVVYARLTAGGLARLNTMFPAQFQMTKEKWNVLSDEDQKQLLRILSALRVGLDANGSPGTVELPSDARTPTARR